MRIKKSVSVLVLTLAGGTLALAAGCGEKNETEAMVPVSTSVGTEVDDTVVTTRVKSALLADQNVKSFDLTVETRRGAVQLSGFVDSQLQIDRAIQTTSAVEGVTSVENRIALKAGDATVGSKIDDGIITARVKSALLVDANVKSFDIAVVTRGGDVQLSGYADDQAQIDRADAIARGVDGVTSVNNGISIKK